MLSKKQHAYWKQLNSWPRNYWNTERTSRIQDNWERNFKEPCVNCLPLSSCLPQPACRLSCSVWMHPSSLIPLARAPTPTRSLATCSAWASWRAERTPARWVSVLLPHPGLLFSTWVSLFWNTQECMSIPGLMERDEVELWVNHRVSFCDINCLCQL